MTSPAAWIFWQILFTKVLRRDIALLVPPGFGQVFFLLASMSARHALKNR